ncbi:MAG TPA: hypothetical protein VFI22_05340 [Thermomicrobiales bacterium]|nr:hypothetical protein [Thermomicrobiales bacterium]
MRRGFVVGLALAALIGADVACGSVALAQQAGMPAVIHDGRCDDLGAVTADLTAPAPPAGPRSGPTAALETATSFTTISASIPSLLAGEHAVVVDNGDGDPVACGEIGGVVADDGSLVVGLRDVNDSGVAGIAYLAPSADGAGVSLFVAAPDLDPLLEAGATPPAEAEAAGPTPTPTLDEQIAAYPPLADVRELAIRPGNMVGQKITFSGTIKTIRVADPGKVFMLGNDAPAGYGVALQVAVAAPDGTNEWVFVGYDGDTTGMFEGTWVSVYGTVVGTESGTNAFGGSITQPLVAADIVTTP